MRLFLPLFSNKLLPFCLIVFLSVFGNSLSAQQDTCVKVDIMAMSGQRGDTVCIQIKLSDFDNIGAFQFGITYDPTVMTPLYIQNLANFPGNSVANVNIDRRNDLVRFQWDDPNGALVSVADGTVLVEICFLLIGNPGDCSSIGISNAGIITPEFISFNNEPICHEDVNPTDQVKILFPPGLTVISNACGTLSNNGTITIKAWGGTAPYDVMSNAPSGNGIIAKAGDCLIISNLVAGNYDFTVKDASGKDSMFTVQVLNAPSIDIRNDINYTRDPTCYNKNDGRIGILFTGGVGSPKIIWSPLNVYGSNRRSLLYAGDYKVIIIDSFGCRAERDFTLRADTLFTSLNIDQSASCAGKCDGKVTVSARGGTPFLGGRYNYYWSSGSSKNCLPGVNCTNDSLCGQQFVIIRDRNRLTGGEACSDTIFFEVPYSGDMSDSLVVDSVRCKGETNGGFRAFISSAGGLKLPLNFTLRNAGLNQVPGGVVSGNQYTSPGLLAGRYYLTVTDSLGCTLEDTIDIFEPFILEIVDLAIDTSESCAPGNDAFIEVRGLGGNPGYRYNWDYQSSTNARISQLPSGTYRVTVTDAKSCTVTKSYTVSRPTNPVINGFLADGVNCPGDSSACIEVLFTPGSSQNLRFNWSVPGTTSRLCNLPAGFYSVTVTDDNNCTASSGDSIRFSGNAIQIDSFVLVHPSCPGKSDGLIIVFAKGGTGALSYAWDNQVNSQVNASIPAGRYIVSVDDVGGCPAARDTFVLLDPPKPQSIVSRIISPTCANTANCDAQASISITTRDTLVTITWSSGEQKLFNSNAGSFADTARGLCDGNQFVIVSVNNLCSDTIYFNVPAAVPVSLDSAGLILTSPSCFGRRDGSISVSAKGGTGPYTYQWIGGPQGSNISGIGDGTFYVQIRDSRNCLHTDSIRLRQPDSLRVQVILGSSLDVSCPGKQDGRITLVWNGGNGGKGSFNWNPQISADSVLTGLSAGIYQVTVTDRKGCTGTASHSIMEPPSFQMELTAIDTPSCDEDQIDFSILSATGGNGPAYRFTIQNGAPNRLGDRIPLFSGTYLVTLFDANGCSKDTTIVIPPARNNLNVDFGSDQETIQLGDSILLNGNVQSSTPIDSIIWIPARFVSTPGSTSSFVRPTSNTTFILTVVDENGCTDFDQILVIVEDKRRVYVPNAISPNGDGINDFLEISVGPEVEKLEYVEVFDRWGARIYALNNPDISSGRVNTWDGSFKGDLLNPGVYVYQVSVLFKDGYKLVYRADITLLR